MKHPALGEYTYRKEVHAVSLVKVGPSGYDETEHDTQHMRCSEDLPVTLILTNDCVKAVI